MKQLSCQNANIIRTGSMLLSFIFLLLSLLPLSACGKPNFTGDYKEVQEAAWELSSYKDDDNNAAISFEENYEYANHEPTLILQFKNRADIEPACEKLKEKLKGQNVPWILCSDREDEEEIYQALEGLECNSAGLIVTLHDTMTDSYNDSAIELLRSSNITRLFIKDADTIEEADVKKMPQLDKIEELCLSPYNNNPKFITYVSSGLLQKFPSMETLKTAGGYCQNNLPLLSSLKHLENINKKYTMERKYQTLKDDPYFNATADLFLAANPQITTINGDPSDSFNGKDGLDEQGVARYHHIIQTAQLKQINTSDYQTIPFDSAKLYGKIAIVDDEHEAISNFDIDGNIDDYISKELKSALANDPYERDVIIRVTTEQKYIDDYSGSTDVVIKAYALETYLEVIDLSKKTISEKHLCDTENPDEYLIRGSDENRGDNVGSFSYTNTWKGIDELYQNTYQKDKE